MQKREKFFGNRTVRILNERTQKNVADRFGIQIE